MMLPHDNWAQFYDFVYEQTFASIYLQLCRDTENVCHQLVEHSTVEDNNASFLDVGAGTGRVAIPLLQIGHHVTAVEPSGPMCDQIRQKTGALDERLRNNLTIIQESIQNTDRLRQESFDIALCVFTVISYILNEEELNGSVKKIANSLKRNGLLLLDVPQRPLFRNGTLNGPLVRRQFTVTSEDEANNLYHYQEKCSGTMNGENFEYSDSFPLRKWQDDEILEICRNNGLVQSELQNDILSNRFVRMGANYYLLKKQ